MQSFVVVRLRLVVNDLQSKPVRLDLAGPGDLFWDDDVHERSLTRGISVASPILRMACGGGEWLPINLCRALIANVLQGNCMNTQDLIAKALNLTDPWKVTDCHLAYNQR
jgi:hypothetical protein